MNDIIIFISGVILGCIISRYFIGVGNKLSINAQDGDTINTKHKPTEQESTE
jgi:hypothetical protein